MQISIVAAAGSPAGPAPQIGPGGGTDAVPESFASLVQKAGSKADRAMPENRTDMEDALEEAADDMVENMDALAGTEELTSAPADAAALSQLVTPDVPLPVSGTGARVSDPTSAVPSKEAAGYAASVIAAIGQDRMPLAVPQGVMSIRDLRLPDQPAPAMPSATPEMGDAPASGPTGPSTATVATVATGVSGQPIAAVVPTRTVPGTDPRVRDPGRESAVALTADDPVGVTRGAASSAASPVPVAAGLPTGLATPRVDGATSAPSTDPDHLPGAGDEIGTFRLKDARRDAPSPPVIPVATVADAPPVAPQRQRVLAAATPDPAGAAGLLPESAFGLTPETGLLPAQQVRDLGGGAFVTTEAASPRPQTPLLAQHVAQQLAVSLRQTSDRMTELALDPAELGKVRMTVKAQDQTIVMTVLADRPETADLMRRHAEILQQEFRALGYTSVTLDVSTGQGQSASTGSGQGGPDRTGDMNSTVADNAADDAAPIATARRADGSLDLRL